MELRSDALAPTPVEATWSVPLPGRGGASLVNAALVTTQHRDEVLLFHVPLPLDGVRVSGSARSAQPPVGRAVRFP